MLSCRLPEIILYEFTDLDGKTHTFEVEEDLWGEEFRGYLLKSVNGERWYRQRCNYESAIPSMIQDYILHADIHAMPAVRRVTPRKPL